MIFTHTEIVVFLGFEVCCVAFVELAAFSFFACKALYNSDTCKGVLHSRVYACSLFTVFHKKGTHFLVFVEGIDKHYHTYTDKQKCHRYIHKHKDGKAANQFNQSNYYIFRAVVSKFCNVKQVVCDSAHHNACIVFVVKAETEFLVMVKQVAAHVVFHSCTHNMSPAGNKILTAELNHIHYNKCNCYVEKYRKNFLAGTHKNSFCQIVQYFRKSKVNAA